MKYFPFGLLCLTAFFLPRVCGAEDQPKYFDPSLPIEQRIDDLLPRMTVEEKITQISDNWGSKAIPRLKVPALLKTEGLPSQSYSMGATIFPEPICMAPTFDPDMVGKIGTETAIEANADHIHSPWSPVLNTVRDENISSCPDFTPNIAGS